MPCVLNLVNGVFVCYPRMRRTSFGGVLSKGWLYRMTCRPGALVPLLLVVTPSCLSLREEQLLFFRREPGQSAGARAGFRRHRRHGMRSQHVRRVFIRAADHTQAQKSVGAVQSESWTCTAGAPIQRTTWCAQSHSCCSPTPGRRVKVRFPHLPPPLHGKAACAARPARRHDPHAQPASNRPPPRLPPASSCDPVS